jgi:DNA-binding NarL/FixJ family response regulator
MRNAALRAQARAAQEVALGPIRCPADSAVAACLLDALNDKEISRAMGCALKSVQNRIWLIKRRTNARNRVGLALALRELV